MMGFGRRKQGSGADARGFPPGADAIARRGTLGHPGDAHAHKPRLLIVSSTYPRWRGDHEPAFVHELARRLIERFEVVVLCPHSPGAAENENLDGVSVHRYRYAPARFETLVNDGGILGNLKRSPWKWLLLPSFVLGQWAAGRWIRTRWRPDVVHAHWLLPQGMVAAWSGAHPFVVTSHGADLFALKNRLFRWMRGGVVTRAHSVTVVSEAMAEKLRAECPRARVHVMPMGVDLDTLFVANSGVVRSSLTMLFVGRLVEKKGLIHLIEAMPRILAVHPQARLDIVGYGPEQSRLAEKVQSLGLDASVRFLGAVTQAELPRHYQSAAVFVAPFVEAAGGDQEGLGLVVAEAAGCLCPVVVGDVPAVHDLLGPDAGQVVASADASALAHAVIHVLEDPAAAAVQAVDLRDRMASRFSWSTVAAGYADLLGEVTSMSGQQHD